MLSHFAPAVFAAFRSRYQTLSIRAEAEQISGSYITVVFKTDPELVETYNAAHGTSYKLCPSEAYEFSTTEVMLPRYNTLSSTMKVELFSERMPDEEPYLLPITIDSIKGDSQATVSPTGSVRYILFNKLVKPGPPAPVLLERSGWKVLAAPKAKPNYEVEKMFDEDINMVFCMWMIRRPMRLAWRNGFR